MPPKKSPKPKFSGPADTPQAVDDLMASLTHPHKGAIHRLRKLILGCDDTIREGVKWNAPSFRTTEYFATVNLRTKTGVGVILHLGAKVRDLPDGGMNIEDPMKQLRWLAKDRATLEFDDLGDVERKQAAVEQVIRSWIRHV